METTRTPTQDRGQALGDGIVAGLIAGVVLLAMELLINAGQGGSIWPVLKGPSLPLFKAPRVAIATPDLWPMFFGLLFHFVISAVWGGLFGLLFFGLSRRTTWIAGLVWGLVVWLAMFYVVLPIFGAFDVVRHAHLGVAIAEHLVFGLSVGLAFTPFQRQLPRPVARRREPERERERVGLRRRTPVTP